jgi:hypothetical protein
VADRSDLALSKLVEDERNRQSPYFRAIVAGLREGPSLPATEDAQRVLDNAKNRKWRIS